MARRALLIRNAKAGNGAADLAGGLAVLADAGIETITPHLDSAVDIADVIRRHRGEVDLVIVAGGDGTLGAAAGGLVDVGLPLGIIPLGTCNDLAGSLDIPLDPEGACRVIAGGRTRRVDLGLANGKPFFNAANIGLGVELARRLDGRAKSQFGPLAYLRALPEAYRATRSFEAHVRYGKEAKAVRAMQLTVGNGRHHGGGMTVSEDARLDDGRLHLYSLAPQGVVQLLARFPELRSGRFRSRGEELLLEAGEVEVETSPPMPVACDGEIVTRTPATFRVSKAALEIFIAAGAQPEALVNSS